MTLPDGVVGAIGTLTDGPTAGGQCARARRPLSGRRTPGLRVVPSLVLVVVVFVVPVTRLLWQSFETPGSRAHSLGLENYGAVLSSSVDMRILGRTVLTASLVALMTLLAAYPFSYIMATTSSHVLAAVMLGATVFSFGTSVIARTFAWIVLLQRDGIVDRSLAHVGLGHVSLSHNLLGAYIGMVQVMLPILILMLYSTMRRIDSSLMVAAESLGATRLRAFIHVYLPITARAIESGVVLVYILSLGFFITPALLGSPQQALMAQLIDTEVSQKLNFGEAGALSVFLIVCAVLGLILIRMVGTVIRSRFGPGA
jgi:putative spermidine/putrescine transport system permease protein